MSRVTQSEGIYFCEGQLEGVPIGPVEAQAATQNTILSVVKSELANKAKAMGGDAVINYSYTQSADRGRSLFRWDQERIRATGLVIKLTQEVELT
jgi:hypothetical protein